MNVPATWKSLNMKKFCMEVAFSTSEVPGAVTTDNKKLIATASSEILLTRLRDFRAESYLRPAKDGLTKLTTQMMIASMVSNRNSTAVKDSFDSIRKSSSVNNNVASVAENSSIEYLHIAISKVNLKHKLNIIYIFAQMNYGYGRRDVMDPYAERQVDRRARPGRIRNTFIVLVILLGVLVLLNPSTEDFAEYAADDLQEILGASLPDGVSQAVIRPLVQSLAERDNYIIFSVFSLPNIQDSSTFIGDITAKKRYLGVFKIFFIEL
ncbi:hypothetical protein H7K49_12935 [Paenibacillus typhae]|nr:hypothetical protein [Paenibacillus typhae]